MYELLTGDYLYADEAEREWSLFFVRLTKKGALDVLPDSAVRGLDRALLVSPPAVAGEGGDEWCTAYSSLARAQCEVLLRYMLVRDPLRRPTAGAVRRRVEAVMSELREAGSSGAPS